MRLGSARRLPSPGYGSSSGGKQHSSSSSSATSSSTTSKVSYYWSYRTSVKQLLLLLLLSILLDAVHPRDGLLHHLRIEPTVAEDDVIGLGDVEPDAARVDGREKHLPYTVIASAMYVAASVTCGCSLCHMWLQPLSPG